MISLRPVHLGRRTGTGVRAQGDLLLQELLESLGQKIWWIALDDFQVWLAVAQQARQASWTREAHVLRQPDGLLCQRRGKLPVSYAARVCGLALHAVDCALLVVDSNGGSAKDAGQQKDIFSTSSLSVGLRSSVGCMQKRMSGDVLHWGVGFEWVFSLATEGAEEMLRVATEATEFRAMFVGSARRGKQKTRKQ